MIARLSSLGRRATEKSPSELWSRAARRVLDELGRALPERPLTVIPSHELQPRTPWPHVSRGELLAALSTAEQERIVTVADAVLAGNIAFGGRTIQIVNARADWQKDPFTGREAPFAWFTDVPYLDFARVGDHKGTWELSRLQWLLVLAQAWKLTGDPRYLVHADAVLDDWFLRNPRFFGMNWTSALEVAFRAITLVAFLHLTADRGDADRVRRITSLVSQIEAHGRFIDGHLSTWFAPNTHLTGEALALLVVGTAWPSMRGASKWVSVAWSILEQEGTRQLRPDGSYFEQSSWYLGYTVDFYVEASRWGALTGRSFPERVLNRVGNAARLLRSCFRPDGTFIALGDDDGGSFWRLNHALTSSVQMTVASAAVHVDPCGALAGAIGSESAFNALIWLHGADAADRAKRSASAIDPGVALVRATAFTDGGIVRIEERSSSGNVTDVMLLDAGPHGDYGHSHDDPLSFDLSMNGQPVVVDPGTASYSDPLVRAAFRQARSHATLRAPSLARAVEGGPFGWSRRIDSRLIAHGNSGELSWLAAEVSNTVPVTARHGRFVLRARARVWLIVDSLDQPSTLVSPVTIGLPLAPGLSVVPADRGVILHRGGIPVVNVVTDGSLDAAAVTGKFSPEYGVVTDAEGVRLSATATGDAAWCYAFCDARHVAHLTRCGPSEWKYDDGAGSIGIQLVKEVAPTAAEIDRLQWHVTISAPDGSPAQVLSIR
jgi:Heparinase II/III-like protein/Heparinase II/III N-terminus